MSTSRRAPRAVINDLLEPKVQRGSQRRNSVSDPTTLDKARNDTVARRRRYSMELKESATKTVTHVNVHTTKGMMLVALRDIYRVKTCFDVLDSDGSGVVTAAEMQVVMMEAQEALQSRREGTLSDKDWAAVKAKFASMGSPLGMDDNFGLLSVLNESLKEGRKVQLKSMLKCAYPFATKKGVEAMLDGIQKTGGMLPTAPGESGPSLGDRKDLDDMWNLFDTDRSGELDTREFKNALKILNVCTDEDFDEIYLAIDTSRNGQISKEEFAAWWFDAGSMTADLSKLSLGDGSQTTRWDDYDENSNR
mmetsp:Transcript_15959/g.30633  ORF Transcript_15959/g.30633 Transcript_15959/m.30633 type:complete len:306 (-) Transcript_15959:182-1099(-)|eukprot:CAMPEP_0114232242 /NCGR_PEP_ID=MMETSP0058-20121206/4497_1 /TAXON_ID=36894 /ORGANISM="Pyramimonas parkeae, CCMP726" /LENGTH=305 /DNA_ID=CAMNT_0001343693 /DNA_START=561 /DNA_END=1478 /DNA_ORIENTATION=+